MSRTGTDAAAPAGRLRLSVLLAAGLLAAAGAAWADGPGRTIGVPAADNRGDESARGTRQGVVAVSHPLAAEAGAKMLRLGGNAIDAAAAIQFALNVVEPQFSGIGGGGFMMIHLARSGQTFIVDSRERAPAAATPTMFQGMNFTQASTAGLSVGVPGTLAGVNLALKRWGNLPLSRTLEPAIELAEHGFRINRFLAANIAQDTTGRTDFQPETRAIFRRPDGTPLLEGDLLVQPDLARTFRLIARHGTDVFYKGEIAAAIVEAQLRTRPLGPTGAGAAGVGRMTLADLAAYQPAIRVPVASDYRGWRVVSMSPPSSGGLTVLQMLEMLERYPLGDAAQGFGFGAPKTMHAMIEAMRLAFADRAVWMGDEDFVPVPKRGLLHPTYVDSRAALISLDARMATPAAGDPRPFDAAPAPTRAERHRVLSLYPDEEKGVHTTHFSVVDKDGNVVSYTTTIENTWGTGITVPGYGFLLNNELTDFNFTPTFNPGTGNPGANDVAPFKRPRSSMTPTIVFKGREPVAAYGSPGGATIINSVLGITLNLVDHGMTIQQAIDAPRLSVTSAAGTASCESGLPFLVPEIPISTQDALRALGHLGLGAAGSQGCVAAIGSVQAVVIDLKTGRQFGGADPRREGTVISLQGRRGGHGHGHGHGQGAHHGHDD